MQHRLVVLMTLLIFSLVTTSTLQAKPNKPVPSAKTPIIESAQVTFEDEFYCQDVTELAPMNTLTIMGTGLVTSDGAEPVITIGLLPPLTVCDFAEDFVVAALPLTAEDGDYLLSVIMADGVGTFNLTIGAVGPVGPQGDEGVQGEQGIQGQQGEQGTQGQQGEQGIQGQQGDTGQQGNQGPPGSININCVDGEIPKWDGSQGAWKCAADDRTAVLYVPFPAAEDVVSYQETVTFPACPAGTSPAAANTVTQNMFLNHHDVRITTDAYWINTGECLVNITSVVRSDGSSLKIDFAEGDFRCQRICT